MLEPAYMRNRAVKKPRIQEFVFRILEKQNRLVINVGYAKNLTRLEPVLLFKDSRLT
jgi:hypothetical protein